MIKITYKGLTGKKLMELDGDYRRMTIKGAEEVARTLQKYLVDFIFNYQLVWRGWLANSVEVKPASRTSFIVDMEYWGMFFERDRIIKASKTGRLPPLLVSWARTSGKLYAPEKFLAIVKKYGHIVEARPFISDAMDTIKNQIEPIMLSNLRRR